MKVEEIKSIIANIFQLKKDVLHMRVRMSSGDVVSLKDYRAKKSEIARLYTKINKKTN